MDPIKGGDGLTFDAGALIAIEKGSRAIMTLVKTAAHAGRSITVPSAVLAQTWRGNSPLVAQALKSCAPDALDWAAARLVGALLGRAGKSDVVDAVVVVSAQKRGDVIVTSDPEDIEHLVSFSGSALKVTKV
jgi:hypothetical protein